ncbi:ATP-dependent helicase [Clostridium fermenticellae]|uniref:DNA 3'-5' helicase n=1 Tax=Clostridium fermenticellae TaxID=2068654 RepID=A0A386H3Y7_9CLOT|nr:ATP-dependent helicase [Clostridium fermenticellae]AYD40439.1 ATP-dependent helicase [Clostridium fermenticellae]
MSYEELQKSFCSIRDKIIEKWYIHLDSMQMKAVLNGDKSCLIVACPGAGKTTVIINRIDYLCTFGPVYNTNYVPRILEEDDIKLMKRFLNLNDIKNKVINNKRFCDLITNFSVNPDNIIVITFTRAAALHMKERYLKISHTKKAPFFGTFHGLFYKIVNRHVEKVNIISSSKTYKLINEILLSYMDSISEEKIKEVINDISVLKNSEVNIDNFDSKIDKDIFKECFISYENYKTHNKLMDFDDLQIKVKKLFSNNVRILNGYRKLFKYMLVDEFQDCDSIQIDLLSMIGIKSSIFAVGDEDQCIYGFRGARPDCMVDFEKYFIDGKKVFLQKNYRSNKNIVDISKCLIKNNIKRNKKPIKASKNTLGNINFYYLYKEKIQSESICTNIEKLVKDDSYAYNDCAVLYRTNIESRSLIDTFMKRGIPFRILDKGYNFFDHFICRDLIAYLKLSLDNTDRQSFTSIINRPFRYVSKVNIDRLRRYRFKENCFDILKEQEDMPVFQIKNLGKLEKKIKKLNKMFLSDAVEFILKDLGYNDYIIKYCERLKIDMDDLNSIIDMFKDAVSDFNAITTFLVHVEEVRDILKNKANDKDGIILSTIHGVKGMEFKNVFIINCNEGFIPHANNTNLEEERRLFYVGMTRAIDNLSLYSTQIVRGKIQEISRFIDECNLKPDTKLKCDKGSKVTHKTFGSGIITNVEDKYVTILFGDGLERKFNSDVLKNSELLDIVS